MQNQQRSQYLDPKDLSLFQFLDINHIQGDQEFLSAIDGIVLNLQLKDHNLLNEATYCNIEPWPFDKTKRSRFAHCGLFGL